ncbi:MAG: hypothetical protein ACOC54_05555 [Candidatus Sumerlaeota bacterium]
MSLPAGADDFIAGYNLEERALLLSSNMKAEGDNLKPFAEMSPAEIATIYHEMWHAYFLLCETPTSTTQAGIIWERFSESAHQIYVDVPADKRLEVKEEATADYIDALVHTYVQVKRFLMDKSPERREEIRSQTGFLKVYSQLFQQNYTGYYTRSIESISKDGITTKATQSAEDSEIQYHMVDPVETLQPFIKSAAEFGLPVGYLEKASRRLQWVVFVTMPKTAPAIQADVVFSRKALPREDMDFISRTLLEDALSSKALEVFSEKAFQHKP